MIGAGPAGPARALALFAMLATSACADGPSQPVLGNWQGEPPGPYYQTPEIVDLTLFGEPGDVTGHYRISTTIQATQVGALGGDVTAWSGTWVREPGTIPSQPGAVIHLKNALASEIDTYVLAPNGDLQPTPDDLGRRLTAEEIDLFSLRPLPKGRAAAL